MSYETLIYQKTGAVTPYLPTSVLSAVLLIVGVQIIAHGIVSDMIRNNQNLHEEILFRVKKNGCKNTNENNSKSIEIINEYTKP